VTERLDSAIAGIDAANAADPNSAAGPDGIPGPKELVHSRVATDWIHRLTDEPSEAQLIAARAHHLRRWEVPRTTYPEGRAGYLKWRRDRKIAHAEQVGSIMAGVGYGEDLVDRVGQIVRKEGLGSDVEVQHHEDALCLTFLQLQSTEVVAELGHERAVPILAKTWSKMSEAGHSFAGELDLDPLVSSALQAALAT